MKTVIIQGGLGNQMFQYAFFLSEFKKNKQIRIDITLTKEQNQHNGFELEKVFNIKGQSNKLSFILFKITRKFPEIVHNLLRIELITDENISQYTNTQRCFYYGYWQNEHYFKSIEEDIRSTFKFNTSKISRETSNLLEKIKESNSISLHIRRGDYLSKENNRIYGNICTPQYYKKAIEKIKEKVKDPIFIVFSNDPYWVKSNFQLENAVYVNFNNGNNSWQDMFLMSQCQHNIIANSSFSWWGAWLNKNPHKLVITPYKFTNNKNSENIIPDTWIKIHDL